MMLTSFLASLTRKMNRWLFFSCTPSAGRFIPKGGIFCEFKDSIGEA